MTSYVQAVITERVESMEDASEQRSYLEPLVDNKKGRANQRNEILDVLTMNGEIDEVLLTCIMGSVDWDDVDQTVNDLYDDIECGDDCDCYTCIKNRPCECQRPECDVVGGTCDWMHEQYEKERVKGAE